MPNHEFDGQRDGEELLFTFRHHLIAMRRGFYGFLIIFAIFSVAALGGFAFFANPDFQWLILIGAVLSALFFFYQWIGWFFSLFIITNERVRQIKQKGLFNRSVIDVSLENIQNVSYNVPGLSGSMFGFGTIVLQTQVGDLVIRQVPKPNDTYNKMSDAIHTAVKNSRKIRKNEPSEIFAKPDKQIADDGEKYDIIFVDEQDDE
jgi:hypothetical protein